MSSIIFTHGDRDGICAGAIYGAIGEFNETGLIKKWERDWDKRTLYFYAGMLIQGITYAGRDYEYKRNIVEALSEDTPPPEIDYLLEAAVKASAKEEEIKSLVREKVARLKNLAYVIDINGYMSPRKELEAFLYDLNDALG